MQTNIQKITPFLWLDSQAEEAVSFYTSIFKNPTIDITVIDRWTSSWYKTPVCIISFPVFS